MKRIPGGSVSLIVTDPPYLLDNMGGGIYTQDDKRYVKELEEIKSGFDLKVLDECCRVMKRINIYLWCSQKQIPIYLDYFVRGKGCNWNLLTWHKTNPIPACNNKYITDTEYCLFFREKGVQIYGDVSTKGTYFITPLNSADKKAWGHPTIKPLSFIESISSTQVCKEILFSTRSWVAAPPLLPPSARSVTLSASSSTRSITRRLASA